MSHVIGLDIYTYTLGENDILGMLTTDKKISVHTTRKMYTRNYQRCAKWYSVLWVEFLNAWNKWQKIYKRIFCLEGIEKQLIPNSFPTKSNDSLNNKKIWEKKRKIMIWIKIQDDQGATHGSRVLTMWAKLRGFSPQRPEFSWCSTQ